MGVLSEVYSGDRIINQYKSSNIKGSIYNKKTSFFPANLSLPRKGMLVLEVYTFGKSE